MPGASFKPDFSRGLFPGCLSYIRVGKMSVTLDFVAEATFFLSLLSVTYCGRGTNTPFTIIVLLQ